MPPLGLLYVAGSLIEGGHEVLVIDQAAEGLTNKAVAERVLQADAELIGISALTSSALRAAEITRLVKKANPNVHTLMGNVHATFCAEKILAKYPCVDLCVRGEGEETIIDVVQALEGDGYRKLKRVKGLTFRNRAGRVVATADRPLIKELDALPIPNRTLLSQDYHIKIGEIALRRGKFTTVVSSRGCPFVCTFCCCHVLCNRQWRARSPENIADELELLESQGYDHFLFADDSFTVNPKRAIKLAHLIRKRRIEMDWIIEGRVDAASREMFQEMVRAGCRLVFFGMESGTQRVLDIYRKKTTPRLNRLAATNARAAGVDIIVGSFILGGPTETFREMQITTEFAKHCDIDFAQFNILGLSPGAPMWDEAIAKGYIDPERYWESGVLAANVFPDSPPLKRIRDIARDAFMDFSLRPRYLVKELFLTLSSPFRIKAILSSVSSLPHWVNLRRLYKYVVPPTDEGTESS
jgi:radical SAM superfamily enzyme YgiQ (UPF0313 family)